MEFGIKMMNLVPIQCYFENLIEYQCYCNKNAMMDISIQLTSKNTFTITYHIFVVVLVLHKYSDQKT